MLLRTLGYGQRTASAPYVGTIDLLYATGARIRCFEETLSKAKTVLEANARDILRGGRSAFGETRTLRPIAATTSSDVLLLISRIERDMKALRIEA